MNKVIANKMNLVIWTRNSGGSFLLCQNKNRNIKMYMLNILLV